MTPAAKPSGPGPRIKDMGMTDSQPWPLPGGRGTGGAGQPGSAGRQAGGAGAGQPGSGGRDGADLGVLLGQVARGDEAAFGLVYGQVAGHVFGIARSVLRDPAQAEEVGQEVLLDVWRDA